MATPIIIAILLPVSLMIFYAVGTILIFRMERRGFNGGICPECGARLYHYDNVNTSRGYACAKCDYFTWVTLSSVDKGVNLNG